MTQDEIIEMARLANFYVKDDEAYSPSNQEDFELTEHLERFAKLVAAKEREACAKVCDDYDVAEDVNTCDTAEGIATAIRARGEAWI